ncbi:uncharacterized protein V1510DRAFT_422955 [Dipodascopsis tothii]|uniref:uncharacterized protein n=1 Tax=Dipodascopsis tothii TaxID=44089 RepID=UPI0034CE8B0D
MGMSTLDSIHLPFDKIMRDMSKASVHDALVNSFAGRLQFLSKLGYAETRDASGQPPPYDEIYPAAPASSAEPAPPTEAEMLQQIWDSKKDQSIRNDVMLFAFWLPVLLVLVYYLVFDVPIPFQASTDSFMPSIGYGASPSRRVVRG